MYHQLLKIRDVRVAGIEADVTVISKNRVTNTAEAKLFPRKLLANLPKEESLDVSEGYGTMSVASTEFMTEVCNISYFVSF